MKRFLAIILLLICCCSSSDDIQALFSERMGKKIILPENPVWTVMARDTVEYNASAKLSVVNYIDSIGCIRCKSQLPLWQNLVDSIVLMFGKNVKVMTFMHPRVPIEAKQAILKDSYPYPVCIDIHDSLNKLNHLPADERLHCFLLDSANRVILIGNPVQNPKIKDLYIRTICDRLGVEHPAAGKDSQQPSDYHDFGNFPFSEAKETEFAFRNESETQIKIDTVFTSCDCTTAAIDRMQIEPGGAAIVKVRFKTDHPEQFMREIYVQYGGQTRVFTIRGTAE